MKVGLPRALHFYTYSVLWYTFLRGLDVQVVLSELSSQRTLEEGGKRMVNSACLPLKILRGHVENLKDQGVDYIFLPRVIKAGKATYTCPKAAGLPELIYQTGRDLPPLLSPVIDGDVESATPYYEMGRQLGKTRKQVKAAYKTALQQWQAAQQKKPSAAKAGQKTIALLGHPYLTEDGLAGFHVKTELQRRGYRVITAQQQRSLPENQTIYPKFMFWQSGHDMGHVMRLQKAETIDGYIFLTAFGCGPDSYIETYCRMQARKQHLPYLHLTVDEQSGAAGFTTRLEAFLDVVERKAREVGA